MSREAHVRICERLGVKFPRPTLLIEHEPLLQQEIGQRLREIMSADIRRLEYAHGELTLGELPRISTGLSWSNENRYPQAVQTPGAWLKSLPNILPQY